MRQICPTYGPPYALEGQLRLLVLHDRSGADLIRKGARLARYDAPTCLAAGQQAVREGKLDEAEPLLKRAVDLAPNYFPQVAEIYLLEASRPDLVRSLAGDDYRRLEQLAQVCAAIPTYAHLVHDLRRAIERSLRRRVSDSTANSAEFVALARFENADGNTDAAIELYRAALSHDYRQVDWHFELAQAYADSNRLEEAIGEVRICLRMRPQHTSANKLLEELIARREEAQK